MDTSVICSLHQWCSLQPGRWWRVIKLWVSSIFHEDAPTHSAHNLHMKTLFTWIKTYSIFNYRHLPMSPPSSYRPHITTILHFVFDTQSIPISPLTNISAARPSCSPVLQGPAAGPLQSPVSVNTRLWPLIGHQPSSGQKYIWPPLENSVSLGTLRKKIFSGNERLSYFLTHWHLISC